MMSSNRHPTFYTSVFMKSSFYLLSMKIFRLSVQMMDGLTDQAGD